MSPTPAIVMSSPGLNHTIAQQALALHEHGMLRSFETTLAFAGGGHHRLAARQLPGVPGELIRNWPWLELARLVSSRVDRSGMFTDWLWEQGDKAFSRHVARRMKGAEAVIGVEHASLELFRAAGEQGLRRIYEVPSAYSGLVQGLLAPLRERHPELVTPYVRRTARIESRRQARRDAEFRLADLVLAHSSFTRQSYIDAGFDGDRIVSVPFAAPPVDEVAWQRCQAGEARAPERPIFLFAGHFALHKGALTLWDAWRQLHLPGARLLVVGDVRLPGSFMRGGPAGIEYLGRLPWMALQRLYQTCTALVFPSWSDGFGMVVTEALAQGLPVIASSHAGAADLIREGLNGMVVPAMDATALAAAMRRLAEDNDLASSMRLAAIESASRWQWSDFRLMLARTVQEHLNAG